MDKFDKAQVGDILYDAKKAKNRWPGAAKWNVWQVKVLDISEKVKEDGIGHILCSWNGNRPERWFREEFNKLRWKQPKEN